MDDLISRAALLHSLNEQAPKPTTDDLYMVNLCIINAPAVDAVPVVHGRWEEHEDCNGDSYYTCSACGCDWTMIEGTPEWNGMRYCPNCGAKNVEE